MQVVEIAGIGPGPFAGMMLADMGADVIRVDRPGGDPATDTYHGVLKRSRRSIAVDLRTPEGVAVVLRLAAQSDALFEGFRPGVAERLGIGPDTCLRHNPTLVYGRMTGWGQHGPLADRAGHDINYIALSGALHAIGRRGEAPVPPLNLVGDFGGGGMLLAFGLVCGILKSRAIGTGSVVDAAMIDGTAALLAMFHGMLGAGTFPTDRGTGVLDTGAPFYDVFETRDGRWVSIGAIEPRFYAELCDCLDLSHLARTEVSDRDRWPEIKTEIATAIRRCSRDELDQLFHGSDACYAPVLDLREVAHHPHSTARESYLDIQGDLHAAPAPRFDGHPPTQPTPARIAGQDTESILADAGFEPAEIDALLDHGAVATPTRT
ncbi:CaiB/BaiF CoA-transferase family protein [Patulibacter sp. NPDC049589]|uniref:CaiB/BaiF CoA transferase family protein n=1 Tax=Patulibacter sp. NPDC049589 TaxID=3154731 RepID=UPI00343272A0